MAPKQSPLARLTTRVSYRACGQITQRESPQSRITLSCWLVCRKCSKTKPVLLKCIRMRRGKF